MDPLNACNDQIPPQSLLQFRYQCIYPPLGTKRRRRDCTESSLQHKSDAITFTPAPTLPLAILPLFQSEKIRDCQNIKKFQWGGFRFNWKVSFEIYTKSDLMKVWQKTTTTKRKEPARKLSHQQQAEGPTFVFLLFTITHTREWTESGYPVDQVHLRKNGGNKWIGAIKF